MLIYSYINTSGNWKNEKLCGNTTPQGGAQRTLTEEWREIFRYTNTALSQSAFRIYKCYIIKVNISGRVLDNHNFSKSFPLTPLTPKFSYLFRDVQRWKLSEKQMCKMMFTEWKPSSPGGFRSYVLATPERSICMICIMTLD